MSLDPVIPTIITSSTGAPAVSDTQAAEALLFGSPKDRLDFYRKEIQ